MEKAVVSVIGKDMVGILAKVSSLCAQYNANVIEVSQSVMQEMFAMIMVVDIGALSCDFSTFSKCLSDSGKELALDIRAMHEDIFNSMHSV